MSATTVLGVSRRRRRGARVSRVGLRVGQVVQTVPAPAARLFRGRPVAALPAIGFQLPGEAAISHPTVGTAAATVPHAGVPVTRGAPPRGLLGRGVRILTPRAARLPGVPRTGPAMARPVSAATDPDPGVDGRAS